MKKNIFLLLLAAAVMLSCSCSQKEKSSANESSAGTSSSDKSTADESSTSTDSNNSGENTTSSDSASETNINAGESSGISYTVTPDEDIKTVSSSLTSPLELNTWGTAAKFCTNDGTYANAPVRIVSIRRGDDVSKEVKELCEKYGSVYYTDPEKSQEYAIAEYEIDLNKFPVGEGGTLCDITAAITGEDGEMIKLSNGSYWGTTAFCMDEETYYYGGVVHSMLAYKIEKEVEGYIITLGEFGETQAYVSCS